ncbi:hypothetical protein [Limosilactobacillus reuteri]|nr:hypothetical protein [Limosilactobacillus reuteri]
MSIFGNAKKAKLKEEALDTKNWISDEEIYSAFLMIKMTVILLMS